VDAIVNAANKSLLGEWFVRGVGSWNAVSHGAGKVLTESSFVILAQVEEEVREVASSSKSSALSSLFRPYLFQSMERSTQQRAESS